MNTKLKYICGAILFFLLGCAKNEEPQVCFKDKCFKVEIADTPQERSKGLMFRKELAQDRGLLFVFEIEDKHGFWMENALIPLDIIWLSRNKEVVHIETNVQPCRQNPCPVVYPKERGLYVLEINAGETRRLGLKAGDQTHFISTEAAALLP